MALPPGFTAIQDATASPSVSLMGVIVSFKEPRKTKGTDWVLDFTIQDDFTQGLVGSSGSIGCRLFRPERSIPKIAVGDIALLRNWKITEWGLKVDCLSDFKSSCGLLVFPAKSIPHPDLSSPYKARSLSLASISGWTTKEATVPEQLAVIRLKHAASDHGQQIQQHATVNTFQASRPARDKRALVKDMVDSSFYDVCAQVVNIYYTGYGTVDLKITDYTENEGLFYYADPEGEDAYMANTRGFTGPYGKMTMSVTLYEKNAAWAREHISQGDYIFLRNMRTKLSPANILEGAMHADRQRPEQVDVRKVTLQKDIEAIKERQRVYDQGRGKQSAFEAIQSYVEPAPTSKKGELSKKAKKRQQQREAKEAELKELEENEKSWEVERSGVNPNIVAAFPEIKLSTISEIDWNPNLNARSAKYNDYKLPFVNAKHRARVRIVDFYPPEIEMFAHSTADPAWKSPPEKRPGKVRWEWGFVLLLEDAVVPPNTVSQKLRVFVGNENAQFLFGRDFPNAADLKTNKRLLNQVTERLFILWGNLCEIKTQLRDTGSDLPLPPGDNRIQNKPFDCCIEEYGHSVHLTDKNPEGWQRMHMLVQTHISTSH